MGKYEDLTGKRFGRIFVESYFGHKGKKVAWNCVCDCGNKFVTVSCHLKDGHTTSCGCYRHEREIEANIKHGKRKTRLYTIFATMKQRCYDKNNPNYKNYGARNIKICDDWLNDFMQFYKWAISNGYTDKLTIERINVNGNYEPKNCKWIPPELQAQNRTTNIRITFNGETDILSNWCKNLGLNYKTIHERLRKGWKVDKAFKTKIRKRKTGGTDE